MKLRNEMIHILADWNDHRVSFTDTLNKLEKLFYSPSWSDVREKIEYRIETGGTANFIAALKWVLSLLPPDKEKNDVQSK